MEAGTGIALGALIASLVALLMTAIAVKNKVDKAYLKSLQDDLVVLTNTLDGFKSRLEECERARHQSQQENVELMRRLLSLENKA